MELLRVLSHVLIETVRHPTALPHELLLLRDWLRVHRSTEPWLLEFRKCQLDIAADASKGFRLDRYEQLLWYGKIPAWLYESAQSQGKWANRCLDVGCGYGALLLYCRRLFDCEAMGTCLETTGNYLNSRSLSGFFDANQIKLQMYDIELDSLEEWRTSFDIVILTETLEHLNYNPVPTLRKLGDLLTPAGRLYLSTPDASARWGRVTKYFDTWEEMPEPSRQVGRITRDGLEHVYQYSESEIREIVEAAGLEICRYDFAPGGINGRHHNLELANKSYARL